MSNAILVVQGEANAISIALQVLCRIQKVALHGWALTHNISFSYPGISLSYHAISLSSQNILLGYA